MKKKMKSEDDQVKSFDTIIKFMMNINKHRKKQKVVEKATVDQMD